MLQAWIFLVVVVYTSHMFVCWGYLVVVGDGMAVVNQIYNGYGEGAPGGKGPSQGRIQCKHGKKDI